MGRASPQLRSAILAITALISLAAVIFFFRRGDLLSYGDAEAHLNIARRILDAYRPGAGQLGSVWLPVPHILMVPFAAVTRWWQMGIAGSIASPLCFVAAVGYFFASLNLVWGARAACVGSALLLLNPNMLYLQSLPMTEPVFLAELSAILYYTLRGRPLAAGAAASLATLTRYEGWFLLPFCAAFFLRSGGWRAALRFTLVASTGPIFWLCHNRWFYQDFLYFYRGPYSAKAIQGEAYYPGKHDWTTAIHYFFAAVRLALALPLMIAGALGFCAALARENRWPVLLLALPPAFYLWSMHSSGNPIYVPHLWPHGWYNTRYALSALPLLAWCGAVLAATVPRLAWIIAVLCVAPWLLHPSPERWITWKESQVNSHARRAANQTVYLYLRSVLTRSDNIATEFNDLTEIYRRLGLPLKRTVSGDDGAHWLMALKRPDLFLRENYVVAFGGDPLDRAARQAGYTPALLVPLEENRVIRVYHR